MKMSKKYHFCWRGCSAVNFEKNPELSRAGETFS